MITAAAKVIAIMFCQDDKVTSAVSPLVAVVLASATVFDSCSVPTMFAPTDSVTAKTTNAIPYGIKSLISILFSPN